MTTKSSASTATKTGDCSWKPQPAAWPSARSPSRMAASTRKLTTTPRPNTMA